MLVKQVMSTHPEYIPPETTLADAAKLMREKDFGFLPIGENDRLIGAITDRDISVRATAEGVDPKREKVRDYMTAKVWYCYQDDDIEKCAKNMKKNQTHRLIVLNDKKRMTGIVSIGDIAKKCRDEELCGEIVEGISED